MAAINQNIIDWGKDNFNFNTSSISQNSKPLSYVTEFKKVDSHWTYRIWNDGYKEIWGKFRKDNVTSKAWGDSVTTTQQGPFIYPISFENDPQVEVTVTGVGHLQATTLMSNSKPKTEINHICGIRPSSPITGTIEINIYASGK